MGMRAAHEWVGCAFRGNAPTMFAVACLFIASTVGAATIYRSFSSREVGFGGGAGVSVPVDSRVAAALDEGAEREAARTKVYVGKVTRVSDGDTLWILTTGGNTKVRVRLDRIDAPESDQPFGKESAAYLKKLVGGREVRNIGNAISTDACWASSIWRRRT